MKKTGKYLLYGLIPAFSVLFCTSGGNAQDPVFSASTDKQTVAAGETFNVKFTIENGRGEISPPDFSDFRVMMGPARSSSFQLINGRQTSTMTLSYTLRAVKEGTYTIGSATAKVGNTRLQSEPLKIEVTAGRSPSAGGTQPGQGRQQQRPSTDKNLFVRTLISKSKLYRGEALVVTFELLSRYNNIDLGETNFPSLDGFWSEDIKTGQTSWEQDYTYIDRVPYRKAVLRKQLLFPQRSGTIEIAPFSVTARVNRSFFNPGTEVKAESYAIEIEVLPLPGGAPESFKGAVGEYNFSANIGQTEVTANDAIDLSLTLTGRGNLRLIKTPEIGFPSDFEVYDPELKDRISVTAGGMSGSRTYAYLVIPRYPGKYEIPAIEYTYFSPKNKKYITEKAGPFEIKVSGEDGLVPSEPGAIARTRVEPTRRDIRYIVTDADLLRPAGKMFFRSFWYYLLTAGPLLFLIGFVLFHKKRDAILGDVKTIRKKKAHQAAKKRLSEAKKAMAKGDSSTFYSEIFSALYGFLSDKLGEEKAALTKPVIRQKLADHEVPDHLGREAVYLIETCEMARFAPAAGQSDAVFYERTAEFIEKLEAHFKK